MSEPRRTSRPKQRRGRPEKHHQQQQQQHMMVIPYGHRQYHPRTVRSSSSWIRCCAIVILATQLLSCHLSLWKTTTTTEQSPSSSSSSPSWLVAASDDYYNENFNDDGNNNNYGNYNNNYNNNQAQQQDDAANNNDDKNNANAGDDAAAAEYFANQYNQNNNNQNSGNGNGGGDDDATSANKNQNDAYKQERNQYQNADDDTFHWNANVGFSGVSVMPVSCINYNNGHMIKFQLFDTENSYQCHFAEISTFVVSIAHYMRAYFNYQALTYGKDYVLPDDAAFLNCIQLDNQSDNNHRSLYAKIGCMERETFTSTKLQLRVYTDAQCSQPYDDGRSVRKHATRGYIVGDDYEISSEVSFKVPFYSCITCAPEQMSNSFNKKNGNWYDDDYISIYGKQQNKNNNGDGTYGDDKYMAVNDDVGNGNNYNNNQNNNDDGRRLLYAAELTSEVNTYADEFWRMFDQMQRLRSLYDNYYDIGEWNMCQRIYKYGMWCDEECRSLDFFRTDQWSGSDMFLLSIMCTFLSGMMLLIVAKRLKAQQKARMYGDDQPLPGLPPFGMAIIFFVIMAVVITLAKLRFVNETLVFAVVTCILLFIYMLKLTLFENRRPVLLAAPRHEIFDNPLDDHLFD